MDKKVKTFADYCREMSTADRTMMAAELSVLCHVGTDTIVHWIKGLNSPRWRLNEVVTDYLHEKRGMSGSFEELFPNHRNLKHHQISVI